MPLHTYNKIISSLFKSLKNALKARFYCILFIIYRHLR